MDRWETNVRAPVKPAPWHLRGSGYIFLLKCDRQTNLEDANIPTALRDGFLGGLSLVMLVDYTSSPVGPYNELLYIPGRFKFANGRCDRSITRIYVDSEPSLVGGRENWGIPKDLAHFTFHEGRTDITVKVGEVDAARFAVKPFGPSLPFSTGLLPIGLRTLSQLWEGKVFNFALSGKGRTRLASFAPEHFAPHLFPDLKKRRVLTGVYVEGFDLQFPVADRTEN
jgi:hypothetical protein